mgnify:CR=1 FL=1
MFHANKGNVHTPDLVWSRNLEFPEQIWIRTVLNISLAQIRPRIDGHEAHFSHVASYCVFVNNISFSIHNGCNRSIAHERMLRIQFVNPVLEANFLRGGRDRFIVKAAAVEA